MTDHATTETAALVRNALAERLRPLRAIDRDVLMRAAVIGREFDLAVVVAASRRDEATVRAAIRRACARQIVERIAGSQDRYGFRHALTHDVVMRELVCESLRPLHRDVAAALERLTRRRPPAIEELAYHWWAAGDPRRGKRYNELAGDRAKALHADAQALLHYRRALDLAAPRSAARARLEGKVAAVVAPGLP